MNENNTKKTTEAMRRVMSDAYTYAHHARLGYQRSKEYMLKEYELETDDELRGFMSAMNHALCLLDGR